MGRFIIITIFCALLAGCASTGLRPLAAGGTYAPTGIDPDGASVDGLIVGHRLMETGEFELALRAYMRAAAEQGMTVDTLSALGSANLRLGRLGQAERLLRQAISADETFVPAWNNLGVVLIEQGNIGEAERVFRTAFALDSGESVDIRNNLRYALARLEHSAYDRADDNAFALVRRGGGQYLLLSR